MVVSFVSTPPVIPEPEICQGGPRAKWIFSWGYNWGPYKWAENKWALPGVKGDPTCRGPITPFRSGSGTHLVGTDE